MDRLNELTRLECVVKVVVSILYCMILTAAVGLGETTDFFSNTIAYTERSFTVEHDIQPREQGKSCVFPIAVSVLDSITEGPVSGALVELRTGLDDDDIMANTTDKNGTTMLSLVLDKEVGMTCMETLLSHGYSIEASRAGYAKTGIGRVS